MSDFLHQLRELLHGMVAWVEHFAATPYGVWALFAIAFAESSFFPIPPDVLLMALCLAKPDQWAWLALVCSVASVTGGMAGYGIGFHGGRPLLKRLFSDAKIRTVERYYERWNAWATGIAGLTPLPYKIFTIAGGAFAIDFRIFVLASAVSRSLRFFAVAGLIYAFGEPIKSFIDRNFNLVTIVFVVCLFGGYWVVTHGFHRAAGADDDEDERP